jgi:fatty acid-binding protein DegV
MKPIISPMPGGVRRLGVARNLDEQIKFALDGLDDMQKNGRLDTILFQYSDNEDRIVNDVMGKITSKHPSAMAFSQPLSNTSGAHMGPGTWALAFIPEYRPNARVKE